MPKTRVHALLAVQIGHLLRTRVLQELDLLVARIRAVPSNLASNIILRQMSRAEWKTMKETGVIPWKGAVCVLVVPPLNKNPRTGERPKPHSSAGPPPEVEDPLAERKSLPPLPPLSTLYCADPSTDNSRLESEGSKNDFLPQHLIPLYNGLALFPSATQRAALYEKLRWLRHSFSQGLEGRQKTQATPKGDERKTSHAFVLIASEETVKRADSVPLAIALWRVRMWEGGGWADDASWIQKE